MNYNKAKELKEAGFPQEGKKTCYYRNPETGKQGGGCLREPLLEEVIEELGDEFYVLEKGNKIWYAGIYDEDKELLKKITSSNGKTPLEAVINLYIKLHEPK